MEPGLHSAVPACWTPTHGPIAHHLPRNKHTTLSSEDTIHGSAVEVSHMTPLWVFYRLLQPEQWQALAPWHRAPVDPFGLSVACFCFLATYPWPRRPTAGGWYAGKPSWTAKTSPSAITRTITTRARADPCWPARGRSVRATASPRSSSSTWPKTGRLWRTAAAPTTRCAPAPSGPSSPACPGLQAPAARRLGASARRTSSAARPCTTIWTTAGNFSAGRFARTPAGTWSRTCVKSPRVSSWTHACVTGQRGPSASSWRAAWRRSASTPRWGKRAAGPTTMQTQKAPTTPRIRIIQRSWGVEPLSQRPAVLWPSWHPFWLYCPSFSPRVHNLPRLLSG